MQNKNLELQKVYEKHIREILAIVRKKLDIIIKFRLDVGKKKIKRLEETLKNG